QASMPSTRIPLQGMLQSATSGGNSSSRNSFSHRSTIFAGQSVLKTPAEYWLLAAPSPFLFPHGRLERHREREDRHLVGVGADPVNRSSRAARGRAPAGR